VNDAMAIYVPGPPCQRRFAKLRLVNTIGITPWKNRDIAPHERVYCRGGDLEATSVGGPRRAASIDDGAWLYGCAVCVAATGIRVSDADPVQGRA
jgi:hypothetical protein